MSKTSIDQIERKDTMEIKDILKFPLTGIPDGPQPHRALALLLRQDDHYFLKFREKISSQNQESEYFTVNFKVTMTRRWKRLLLQTYLDSLVRREDLHLTFADFLILEELYQRVLDIGLEERSKGLTIQDRALLSCTEKFLHYAPLRSLFYEKPGIENFREKIVAWSEMCKFFSFTDERTFRSRLETYQPSKFLEITVVVPLSDPERTSLRYSSYCKGHPTPGRKGEAPLPLDLQPTEEGPSNDDPNLYAAEVFWNVLLSQIQSEDTP